MRRELDRGASEVGLLVNSSTLDWVFDEREQAILLQMEKARENEVRDYEAELLNRTIARANEITSFQLNANVDVDSAKVATEIDLQRLILDGEVSFIDARNTGVRIQQLKQLEHELVMNRMRRLDGLKAELEAEDHKIDMARSGQSRQSIDLEMETREREHDLVIARIQSEIRIVERAIEDADTRAALELKRLEETYRVESDVLARQAEIDMNERQSIAEADGVRRRGNALLDVEERAGRLRREDDAAEFAQFMAMQAARRNDRQADRTTELEKALPEPEEMPPIRERSRVTREDGGRSCRSCGVAIGQRAHFCGECGAEQDGP